jgi:hypothetical protein
MAISNNNFADLKVSTMFNHSLGCSYSYIDTTHLGTNLGTHINLKN